MSEEERALEPVVRSMLEGMADPELDDFSWLSNLQAVLGLRRELNPDAPEIVRHAFDQLHDTIQKAMDELSSGV